MSYPTEYPLRKKSSRNYSLSGALATSLGINPAMSNNFSYSSSPLEFSGRNFNYTGPGSYQSSSINIQSNMPKIHSDISLNQQTVDLASIGIPFFKNDSDRGRSTESFGSAKYDYSHSIPIYNCGPPSNGPTFGKLDINNNYTSLTPLISSKKSKSYTGNDFSSSANNKSTQKYGSSPEFEGSGTENDQDLESGLIRPQTIMNQVVSSLTFENCVESVLVKPLHYLPAVLLGLLLNILDGLSYGMILFPIAESMFSNLAPAGLSMFYISCIISQLVYSLGGSAFRSGIGSEMIEVTPFFHAMAMSIVSELGGDQADQATVLSNVIFSYAISSIVTGLVFFLLGKWKLGRFVGFFPRHILIGCIGGVGYFLVITGIEVSSRLEGGIEYNLDVLEYLFSPVPLLQWTTPLFLTLILIYLQKKIEHSSIVPSFFISIFIIFHIIVKVVPSWNLQSARDSGWIFSTVKDKEPWYSFYHLYKFELLNWWVILRQFPTMLALTFFGILHVPINVPALAITVGMDQFDVDRELVAHGYSNLLSGLFGSIQNYLVYTNSVLFIRAGADSRVAGVMLAIATAGIMVAGPVIIGYIPVCVVGSLIYLLGYELLKESLYDTYGKLKKIEYTTIVIIVLVMGAWDFVYGVFAGILLASLSFVVEAARRTSLRGSYTGEIARSTVLRHPKQQDFIKAVGDQINVIKLQGTLFFGSIGGVEESIRDRFDFRNYKANPLRYLILDMVHVVSIDFSAAEGFRRIQNLTNEYEVQLIISSVTLDSSIVKSLRDAGLWDNTNKNPIQLFEDLNSALEWCENSFLSTYKKVQIKQTSPLIKPQIKVPNHTSDSFSGNPMSLLESSMASPRRAHVYEAASKSVKDEQLLNARYTSNYQEPLPLLMITFQGLSDKDESFWSNILHLFVKESIPKDTKFYNTLSSKHAFFIVESGLVKSEFKFEETRDLSSHILPLTAFGDLNSTGRNSKEIVYSTVIDSVLWKLDESKIEELLSVPDGDKIYTELLKIEIKLVYERFSTMTSNLLITC